MSDTLNMLREARTNRERLFGELENLRAREQVEGPTDGVSERIGNINRAISRADERIQELEAEHGRGAIAGTTRYDAGIGVRLDEAPRDARMAYLQSLARAGYIDRPDESTATTAARCGRSSGGRTSSTARLVIGSSRSSTATSRSTSLGAT
jgi:hypothetical protein